MNKNEAQLNEDYGVNVGAGPTAINGIPVVYPTEPLQADYTYVFTYREDPEKGPYFEFMHL